MAHYEAILKFINKLENEESDIRRSQIYPRKSKSINSNENADLDFPDDILDLIEKGQDVKAAEHLVYRLKAHGSSSEFLHEAIHIQASLSTAAHQFYEKLIKEEDKDVKYSRIRKSMLALIDQIKERKNS